jgi:hypothetical protein
MAQMESYFEKTENPSLPHLTFSGFPMMGKKSMEEFAKAQAELFGTLQKTHRHWFDRIQTEAKLASEFADRATNARSIPDAVAACQEWTSRRFEMMATDGTRLLADSQKIMEAARFLFTDGHDGASTEVTGDHPE